ncbi:hypothetical protein [Candidatus Hakubella thermalkaliphila]|uniref:Uncharacterized protein n=3 Tax=Candidatus Hakubella thermalkaliphila TaxID=2754717 RepID=A0A6V8P501_9ACTN|nr:hypothetical protein [Candidatus Hakubella thermalkaliphila]MBT9167208.1 hypothetical protein [Bacillota bacterium]MBT9174062.1 hypothetical protein [Bacillota bacterium]GFP24782.1 hypothetical protein HKBW3S25_00219 [Candidatus Hakubella thermalkaliphila]GFP26950.1 hypothetical protein HKBW3S33_00363 [Candidatus Hakubella thermalkaliphila]GFP41253.1 hypothetical protein HKBW3C_00379 [Candidatus Hakubella thermalkaliphila]
MVDRYWESEAPLVVRSKRNVLRYYPQVAKLQVSLPDWEASDGQVHYGKTVTLDIQALVASEDKQKVAEVLGVILKTLKGED